MRTAFLHAGGQHAKATLRLRARPQFDLRRVPARQQPGRRAKEPAKQKKLHLLFLASLLVIGCVSCADGILNIIYPVTAAVEENPIAAAILRASNDSIALLMALKAAGTILVLGFLQLYSRYKYEQALLIAGVLAGVQMWVLGYILFA
jgi:hypothetical protein